MNVEPINLYTQLCRNNELNSHGAFKIDDEKAYENADKSVKIVVNSLSWTFTILSYVQYQLGHINTQRIYTHSLDGAYTCPQLDWSRLRCQSTWLFINKRTDFRFYLCPKNITKKKKAKQVTLFCLCVCTTCSNSVWHLGSLPCNCSINTYAHTQRQHSMYNNTLWMRFI